MTDILRTVSVSGGKDSTALYCWAIEKFGADGFLPVFADTGHEHPVTLNYVRNLPDMAGGPPIAWVSADFRSRLQDRAKKGDSDTNAQKAFERNREVLGASGYTSGWRFLDLIIWKGRPPSRKAQFCTEELKLRPIKEWLDAVKDDRPVVQYTGIRAGESAHRAKMKRRAFASYYMPLMGNGKPKSRRDKSERVYHFRPLLRWSEEDVFSFLESKGVPPNPLYALGFDRVGCFPCINAGKRELSRLPDWAWDRIQEYETRSGRTWFHWGMIPPSAEQRKLIEALPRDTSGVIDEAAYKALLDAHPEWMPTVPRVREWSMTTRGGSQYDLFAPKNNDVQSCMSTWGQCE